MKRTGVQVSAFRTFIHKILLYNLGAIQVCRNDTGLTVLARENNFIFWEVFGWFGQQLFWHFRRVRVSPFLLRDTWHDCRKAIWTINLSWKCMGGEIDEFEEDLGWSFSCLESVMSVEESKLEEEFLEPRTTIGTTFPFSTIFEYRFEWDVVFWLDPLVSISVFIEKLSKRQYCWVVFEDFLKKNPILWHKLASSCVCTSPFDFITVVRVFDVVNISNSEKFNSFLLIMWVRRMLFELDPLILRNFWPTFTGTSLLPFRLVLRPILKKLDFHRADPLYDVLLT